MNVYKDAKLVVDAIGAEPDTTTYNLSGEEPIDFWHPPLGLTANISTAIRKSGVNLITATILGSDAGQNYGMGLKLFSWGSDATVAAGNDNDVNLPVSGIGRVLAVQTVGNGVRFQVPVVANGLGSYHRKLRLRVWDYVPGSRQTSFAASLVGDSTVTPYTEAIGGGINPWNDGLTNQHMHLTTVTFWSDRNCTLQLDCTRNGGSSMGQWGIRAAKLDLAPIPKKHTRGATRRLLGFAR